LRLSFDIEGNGLLDQVTTIHCIVTEDIDTGECREFEPHEIEEGVKHLMQASTLIGHNILGYDLPAIKKLYGEEFKGETLDTLVLSRLARPDRSLHPQCPAKVWDEHNQKDKAVGPHTLMNLGYYAGLNKGDFGSEAGWEYYSKEMLEYCKQDVLVTTRIYNYLKKELQGFSDQCILLEHQFNYRIQQQMEHGWFFDIDNAMELEAELTEKMMELEDEVHKTFKPMAKFIREIQPRVVKSGGLSSVGLKFLENYQNVVPIPDWIDGEYGVEYINGEFSRIDWVEFNLGSRQQIADQLLMRGWKPKEYTENGNIIVNEKVLGSIASKFEEAKLLADYFMISKKKSMVSSWIEKYNSDTGRIHGYVNTLGAATRRCTHSGPNLAQVPASKTDKEGHLVFGFEGGYGADCRKLFTVPRGYKQVGCDASGLELRCLAHYMNDKEYTDLILHGDIHSYNQKAAGLPTRNNAKTFIYGFLYGAGDAKIGEIVNGTAKDGKRLKTAFLNSLPSLKKLKEGVAVAATRGWLKSIDGSKIRIKSEHAALNFLLQSAGAIVMKQWLVLVCEQADKEQLDYHPVGNIHDEGQFEVADKDVKRFCEICESSMNKAGEMLGFRCQIDGEAMVGSSWAATH